MARDYEDLDDFLMSGGTKACSFLKIGDQYEGEIVSLRKQQQTDPDGELKFWPSGEAMMEVVAVLQTDLDDPEVEDDDGKRGLYISYMKLKAVQAAIKEAQKENPDAGIKGLRIGGWLGMAFTRQDKPKARGKSGTKHFEAWYEAPEPGAETDDLTDWNEPDEQDEAPSARGRRPAAKKAPAKKAAPARGRRAPEPDEDESEQDEAPSARGRRPAAKKAPAKKAAPARGRGRPAKPAEDDLDEYGDEDSDESF